MMRQPSEVGRPRGPELQASPGGGRAPGPGRLLPRRRAEPARDERPRRRSSPRAFRRLGIRRVPESPGEDRLAARAACGGAIATASSSARAAGEPRGASKHGVANGLGYHLSRCEHLGDEEGVAAGSLVERGAVDSMRLGEVSDCLGREWRQRQPHARCTRSEFAEHLPQRVEAAQLGLAIAHQQCSRSDATRRPTSRSTSSVASSAQCTSSSTRIPTAPAPGALASTLRQHRTLPPGSPRAPGARRPC